jgi:hypothetical protein
MKDSLLTSLIPFSKVREGCPFYIDRYPANTYRKTGRTTAEFVFHPAGYHHHPAALHVSSTTPVRLSALSPQEAKKAAKATDPRMFCWKSDPLFSDLTLAELRALADPKPDPMNLLGPPPATSLPTFLGDDRPKRRERRRRRSHKSALELAYEELL